MRKIMCKGCKKEIDEIDLWDSKKKLCDKCSMKENSNNQSQNNNQTNQLNLSYIN